MASRLLIEGGIPVVCGRGSALKQRQALLIAAPAEVGKVAEESLPLPQTPAWMGEQFPLQREREGRGVSGGRGGGEGLQFSFLESAFGGGTGDLA